MRNFILLLAAAGMSAILFSSCKKPDLPSSDDTVQLEQLSSETAAKIKALGFSTADVRKVDEGWLVEGDILLTDENLEGMPYQLLRAGDEEQYRTTRLVTGLPRTIKVIVTGLGTAFVAGTDTAIARYNRLNLQLHFQRITSGTANITIQGFNQGPSGGYITLGSSGFPTASGNPYSTIKMNTNQYAYGSNPNVLYVGSVIQHEIGHCIGMRHTDYYNRAISCGGTATNEGASNVGAILIPGTPSTATNAAGSWMLACSNGGNRTFNANDVTALNYLY